MAINVLIPDPLAGRLLDSARSLGKTPEEVVLDAVAHSLAPIEAINQLLAPVRAAFAESGVSEEEAIAEFEREKHALRGERRGAAPL